MVLFSKYFQFVVDNEIDGESLETLMGTMQGQDCLKELILKLGVRLKVYQRIRASCDKVLSYSVSHIEPEAHWFCM